MSLREYFESDLDYFAWSLENASSSGKYFEYNGNLYLLRRFFVEHYRTYIKNKGQFANWCENNFTERELHPASSKRSGRLIKNRCPELSKEESEMLDFALSLGVYQEYILTDVSYLSRFCISKDGKHIYYDYLPDGNYNKLHSDLIQWIKFVEERINDR